MTRANRTDATSGETRRPREANEGIFLQPRRRAREDGARAVEA